MDGWTCPKCGRVWAPCVIECGACNGQAQPYTSPTPTISPTPWTPYEPTVPQPYTPTWPQGTGSPAPWAGWLVWCETRGETQ